MTNIYLSIEELLDYKRLLLACRKYINSGKRCKFVNIYAGSVKDKYGELQEILPDSGCRPRYSQCLELDGFDDSGVFFWDDWTLVIKPWRNVKRYFRIKWFTREGFMNYV